MLPWVFKQLQWGRHPSFWEISGIATNGMFQFRVWVELAVSVRDF